MECSTVVDDTLQLSPITAARVSPASLVRDLAARALDDAHDHHCAAQASIVRAQEALDKAAELQALAARIDKLDPA